MKTGTYGRTPVRQQPKGGKWKYHHEFEHRGSGIVAIYSYGPVGEHDALVAEAKRVMRARFGVSGAVGSGGISGWPQDDQPELRELRIVETQTIFCIDAVGGPNRKKPREVAPSVADWHVGYIVDVGQDYLGHGEVNLYFTGPLLDEDEWRELVDRLVCEGALEAAPTEDRATVLELKVSALSQGRYWFLSDDGPLVDVDRFEVTP
jgi:hypothetical protein